MEVPLHVLLSSHPRIVANGRGHPFCNLLDEDPRLFHPEIRALKVYTIVTYIQPTSCYTSCFQQIAALYTLEWVEVSDERGVSNLP